MDTDEKVDDIAGDTHKEGGARPKNISMEKYFLQRIKTEAELQIAYKPDNPQREIHRYGVLCYGYVLIDCFGYGHREVSKMVKGLTVNKQGVIGFKKK